jgi:hypothetical protein
MAGLGRRKIGNSTAERVENAQTHVKSKKNGGQKSRLGCCTPGTVGSGNGGKTAQKKASAHGAGVTFRHTENRKGLRYNDRSVYP